MQKIGIVGFGIVGKSVYKFFKKNYLKTICNPGSVSGSNPFDYQISIWDKKKTKNIFLSEFLKSNDFNVISPGISAKQYLDFYRKFPNKVIGELDLFSQFFKKTTIAVTGSLGKTSITKLIEFLLKRAGRKVLVGGNIGTGMLDLVKKQKFADLAVLELSSFQLFLNKKFATDIAVWSNFHPNHLDWHTDLREYFFSKFKILQFQNASQSALVSLGLLFCKKEIKDLFLSNIKNIKSKIYFVCQDIAVLERVNKTGVLNNYSIFYLNKNYLCSGQICFSKINNSKKIFDISILPDVSLIQNWLFALLAVYLHGVRKEKLDLIFKQTADKKLLFGDFANHRLEHFATINKIDFYNDSKATVIQATNSALDNLNKKNRSIILILGGLDKGIDRFVWIKKFRDKFKNLKVIYSFGSNCKYLKTDKHFPDTHQLVKDVHNVAQADDIVLFSPGGSSFDLFKNYKQRGENFKKLVLGEYGKLREQAQKRC